MISIVLKNKNTPCKYDKWYSSNDELFDKA